MLCNVKGVVERKLMLGTNETTVHVKARVQKMSTEFSLIYKGPCIVIIF
jgi:hypothetical protein